MSYSLEIKSLCNNVKKIRKRYSLSKKAMSMLLEISVYSLNKLENHILPPRLSAEIILRICIVFKISIKELFSC